MVPVVVIVPPVKPAPALMLLTVPLPPGKVWPLAKVTIPELLMLSPPMAMKPLPSLISELVSVKLGAIFGR